MPRRMISATCAIHCAINVLAASAPSTTCQRGSEGRSASIAPSASTEPSATRGATSAIATPASVSTKKTGSGASAWTEPSSCASARATPTTMTISASRASTPDHDGRTRARTRYAPALNAATVVTRATEPVRYDAAASPDATVTRSVPSGCGGTLPDDALDLGAHPGVRVVEVGHRVAGVHECVELGPFRVVEVHVED